MKRIGKLKVRDTLQELTDPRIAALLVVDLQNDFCHANGSYAHCGKDMKAIADMLPTAIVLIREAQELSIRCVFIRQITLLNGKGDSPAWLRFKVRDGKSPDYALERTWGSELLDDLTPEPQDLVVDKLRPDAFHGTSLELLLRTNGIQSVIVLCVLTEGCVESTVRAASYHDFYTVGVEDCIASTNPINHEGSMNLYRARYPLASSHELLDVWRNET